VTKHIRLHVCLRFIVEVSKAIISAGKNFEMLSGEKNVSFRLFIALFQLFSIHNLFCNWRYNDYWVHISLSAAHQLSLQFSDKVEFTDT
jgi:hypothetical protein